MQKLIHRGELILYEHTKTVTVKWQLYRKLVEDASFEMMYQLLRITFFPKTKTPCFTGYPCSRFTFHTGNEHFREERKHILVLRPTKNN